MKTNLHPSPVTALGKAMADSARKQRLESIRRALDEKGFYTNVSGFSIAVKEAMVQDVTRLLSPLQKDACTFTFTGIITEIEVLS
jgi:hypothetical protein